MSKPDTQGQPCPVCGPGKLRWWDDLETWICEECSFVVEDKYVDGEFSLPETTAPTDTTNRNESKDWQAEISSPDRSEASLIDVLSEVQEVAEALDLPVAVEQRTAEYVTEAWKSNFMLGRTKSDTVAAATYAATRKEHQSVPPAFISAVMDTETRCLKDTYTSLRTELRLTIPIASPDEYIAAIAAKLGVNDSVAQTATNLLDQSGPVGGNPVGIAAAALYTASTIHDAKVTQREVANLVGLTKETIWRHSTTFKSADG